MKRHKYPIGTEVIVKDKDFLIKKHRLKRGVHTKITKYVANGLYMLEGSTAWWNENGFTIKTDKEDFKMKEEILLDKIEHLAKENKKISDLIKEQEKLVRETIQEFDISENDLLDEVFLYTYNLIKKDKINLYM